MLELVNHFSGYDNRQVLRNVSIAIKPGEVVAIVGESGAGKSTLLRQLYRVSPTTIALCPQSLGLVSTLSVFHNIYMGKLAQRSMGLHLLNLFWPQKAAWQQVLSVADEVGVGEFLRQPVSSLSGGQQQRVALARAILQGQQVNPEKGSGNSANSVTTFIGDEPVSSVDQKHGAELLETLKKRFSRVIVATHDRQLALDHFDRIVGVRHGQVAFDALSSELSMQDLTAICRDQ